MSSTFDLLFRTSDSSRWGDGVTPPRPLTAEEVDTNFWILLKLYLALEENPAEPANISDITVANNLMTITLSNGSSFGPFPLPVATFRWRENWQANTSYLKFDLFNDVTGLYMVNHDLTSASSFDPNASDIVGDEYSLLVAYPVNFDIGFFFPGLPGTGIADGAPVFAYQFARPAFMRATLPDSVGGVGTAATAALSFPIQQNGTVIGSANIGAGQSNVTFTFSADVQFETNDVFEVMKPASIDATAANLTITFAAIKGLIEAASS